MAATKKKSNQNSRIEKAFSRKLATLVLWVFLVKLIIIFNINGAWPGADAENYIEGTQAFLKEGFFSTNGKLLLWPAGYPFLIAIFAKIKISWTLYLLSIFQSAIFAYAVYLFGNELQKTRINRVAFPVAVFISINPTLSLASTVTGYESIVCSGLLIIVSIIMSDLRTNDDLKFKKKIFLVSSILSFISFMQPKFLSTLIVIFLWIFLRKSKKNALFMGVIALCITMISPTLLVARNIQANNIATISNNLGYTMNIGAGPDATGGYTNNAKGVSCPDAKTDFQVAKCVATWELTHPEQTAKLVLNRAIFFWSPWYGAEANGTMARNPWLKFPPAKFFTQNKAGFDFATGTIGSIISWVWIAGQLIFMFLGFNWIRKFGGNEKIIAALSLIVVVLSWLISIVTIGDHRFRIPIMGLSIFLQVAGFTSLNSKEVKAALNGRP